MFDIQPLIALVAIRLLPSKELEAVELCHKQGIFPQRTAAYWVFLFFWTIWTILRRDVCGGKSQDTNSFYAVSGTNNHGKGKVP